MISENCLRSTTNMFVFVFDEQVNHVKQTTNMFNHLTPTVTIWVQL